MRARATTSVRLVRLSDATPPTMPLVADPGFNPAAHTVALSWVASSDNIQVDHYVVLRDGVPLGATDATAFTDATPPQHALLSYVVRAVDTNGNATDSAPAPLTTPDWTPPTAPLPTLTPQGTTVTLRWPAATRQRRRRRLRRPARRPSDRPHDGRAAGLQGCGRAARRAHMARRRSRRRRSDGVVGADHKAHHQGDRTGERARAAHGRRRNRRQPPATRSRRAAACSWTCASSERSRSRCCGCT